MSMVKVPNTFLGDGVATGVVVVGDGEVMNGRDVVAEIARNKSKDPIKVLRCFRSKQTYEEQN